MGRHRAETIRSYVKHGEIYAFTLVRTDGTTPGTYLYHWLCSCTEEEETARHYRPSGAVVAWKYHVEHDHPDAA